MTLALALIMLAFCGCADMDGHLTSLPKAPNYYIKLQSLLDEIIDSGAEFAIPTNGLNRSAVQFVDLDGDGQDEVLALFRTKQSSALVFYVYQKVGDDYVIIDFFEGAGESIDCIYFPRVQNGKRSVLVGLKLGESTVRGVLAYTLEADRLRKVFDGKYNGITVADVNSDGFDEVVLVLGGLGETPPSASFYTNDAGRFTLVNTVGMVGDVKMPEKLRLGMLTKDIPALFIDSRNEAGQLITDVIYYSNLQYKNLMIEEGAEVATRRVQEIYCTDINSDGIVDIPTITPMPGYEDSAAEDAFWRIDWFRYDKTRGFYNNVSTFQNTTERWYFILPTRWINSVTVKRGEGDKNVRVIQFVACSPMSDGTLASSGPILLQIYRFSVLSADSFVLPKDLSILRRTSDAVFAAMTHKAEGLQELSISAYELDISFRLMKSVWIDDSVDNGMQN